MLVLDGDIALIKRARKIRVGRFGGLEVSGDIVAVSSDDFDVVVQVGNFVGHLLVLAAEASELNLIGVEGRRLRKELSGQRIGVNLQLGDAVELSAESIVCRGDVAVLLVLLVGVGIEHGAKLCQLAGLFRALRFNGVKICGQQGTLLLERDMAVSLCVILGGEVRVFSALSLELVLGLGEVIREIGVLLIAGRKGCLELVELPLRRLNLFGIAAQLCAVLEAARANHTGHGFRVALELVQLIVDGDRVTMHPFDLRQLLTQECDLTVLVEVDRSWRQDNVGADV